MSYTPLVDTIFTGNVRVPTAAPGDNDTTAASTAFVTGALATAASDYVTLSGSQTITGDKTHRGQVLIDGDNGGWLLHKNIDVQVENGNAGSAAYMSYITGEAANRYTMDASGKMYFGGGAAAADVTLERTAANVLSLGADDFLRIQTSPLNDT